MTHAGGCLCGQVRYQIEGDPVTTAVCHCTNCQRQSGAAFSVNVLVPEPQLKITGDLKTYEDKGDSGAAVYRRFCENCGSPIVSELGASPGMMAVKLGTLDDTSGLKPAAQIYCDSKQAWVELSSTIMAFPKAPPSA